MVDVVSGRMKGSGMGLERIACLPCHPLLQVVSEAACMPTICHCWGCRATCHPSIHAVRARSATLTSWGLEACTVHQSGFIQRLLWGNQQGLFPPVVYYTLAALSVGSAHSLCHCGNVHAFLGAELA